MSFTLGYVNTFTAPLPPTWAIYSGVPACCSLTRWDEGQVVWNRTTKTLSVRNTKQPDGSYLSGGLSSKRALPVQTYGRYRVRFRWAGGTGVKMCLLLWQNAPNPAAPDHADEIDFAETGVSTQLSSTLHHAPGNTLVQNRVAVDTTQWHVVGVTWRPGILQYTLDGRVWSTTIDPAVPAQPMHLDLQTTTGFPNPVDASTPAEVDLEIDWIKVWSYTP